MKEADESKYAHGPLECTLSFFLIEGQAAGDNKRHKGVRDQKEVTKN